MNWNEVRIAGNLTRDPQVKYTPSGAANCEFTVAINEQWKDAQGNGQKRTHFIDCQAWKRTAEIVGEYCRQGSSVFVSGKLSHETWEDKTTQQKRSRVRVVVEAVQLLGSKPDSSKPPKEQREPVEADRPPEQDVPF